MPQQVTMPRLDKDMKEGRIAAWLKSEGDAVSRGEALFEIETDKAAIEVDAEADGVLHHLGAEEGQTVPVGGVVAWIYAADEEVGLPPEVTPAETEKGPAAAAVPVATKAVGAPATPAATGDRIAATPAARTEARARGISLKDVQGTGPSARIQKSDILAAAQGSAPVHDADIPATFEDRGGPLSILSSGSGARLPVVMIHGFLADASGWEKLAQPLGNARRVHRIELPCHGRSPLRRLTGFADLAREVRHAFDGLGLERCHLVGHSLGGAVALALADTRPRTVASLTLIAPAGLGPEINGAAVDGMCRAARAESLGPWMKLLTADPDAIGWPYVQAAAAMRRDPGLRAAQSALADAMFPDGVQAFDLRPALDRLATPTRIIWGRDDRIISWNHALTAPGAVSLNLFRGVGHMPHYEAPERILPFLQELD